MDFLSGQLAAVAASCLLVIAALFQIALAAGLPLGEWAYGGFHPGILPRRFRISSAIAAAVWFGFALVLLDIGQVVALGLSPGVQQAALWVLAVLMGLGTVMNALSKSKKERLLWTPQVALLFLLCLYLLI